MLIVFLLWMGITYEDTVPEAIPSPAPEVVIASIETVYNYDSDLGHLLNVDKLLEGFS